MKKQFELGPLMEYLPATVRDSVFHQAKEEGKDTDSLFIERRGYAEKAKTNQLDVGSRAAVKYVSTRTMDRDKEIIVPSGINTKEYMKYAHVLWGHNYSLPPIGSDEWIKADEFGLLAKTIYADTGEGTMANVLWHLVQQGHQKASSIGFVPLTTTQPGHNDFEKVLNKLESQWPEIAKNREKIKAIITKAILLEHSDVSVPANVDSEVIEVAKSFGADDVILKSLGFEEIKYIQPEGFKDWDEFLKATEEWDSQKPYPNEHAARLVDPAKYEKFRRQNNKFGPGIHAIFGVIDDGKAELQAIRFDKTKFTVAEAKVWLKDHDYKPIAFEPAIGKENSSIDLDGELDDDEEKSVVPFKEESKSPESTEWTGTQETVNAEISDLKLMCTWYDKENPKLKGSYKLLHHKASGTHPVVWNGVRMAMAGLLGARGGINIPVGDKPRAYTHLSKHYEGFGKTLPELREYLQGELKQIFPEMYDVTEDDDKRSIRVVHRHIRVVDVGKRMSFEDLARKMVEEAFDKVRGKI